MHATLNQINLRHADEIDMLACIVEAMLDARDDLQDATQDEWSEILVDSCRRQKRATGTRPYDAVCC